MAGTVNQTAPSRSAAPDYIASATLLRQDINKEIFPKDGAETNKRKTEKYNAAALLLDAAVLHLNFRENTYSTRRRLHSSHHGREKRNKSLDRPPAAIDLTIALFFSIHINVNK